MGFPLEPSTPHKGAFPQPAADASFTESSWGMTSSSVLIDNIENEVQKMKAEKKRAFHDSWEKWLAKTFCVVLGGSFDEILLANARQAFDEFQALTATRLGLERSRIRFFSLCENIPLQSRKKILSTVAPRQLALTLSGFAVDDFKKEYQAMASAYRGNSDEVSVEARESCIALFSMMGNESDGLRKAVVAALDRFVSGIAPMVGKSNAAKMFMRLTQCIPKAERQKIFLAMSPQDFGEMLYHFLF